MHFKVLAVIVLLFMVMTPWFAFADGYTSDARLDTVRDTVYTVGQKASGSFGLLPTSQSFFFNLPANSQIAVYAIGATISSLSIYKPDWSFLTNIPTVSGGVYKYGVFTTSVAGDYELLVSGSSGDYKVSCINGYQVLGNANTSYNRTQAANYAFQYYANANPLYHEFTADCTNFVSQAVHCGGMNMLSGGGTDNYWHYTTASNYSPSWTSADFFMRHWSKVRQKQYTYYGRAYSVRIYTKEYILMNKASLYNFISVGDTVHYLNGTDSKATHSQIFQRKDAYDRIMTCSHSDGFYYGNWFDYVSDEDSFSWIVVIKISNN